METNTSYHSNNFRMGIRENILRLVYEITQKFSRQQRNKYNQYHIKCTKSEKGGSYENSQSDTYRR